MMRITPAVKHLLILNVIIFVGTAFLGNKFFYDEILALSFPINDSFNFWQIITHMFMHGDIWHLVFNMFALWMFGSAVELSFGQHKFLFFYLSCGLGAFFFNILWDYYNFETNLKILVSLGYESDMIINTLGDGKYIPTWVDVLGKDNFDQFIRTFSSKMLGASGAIYGVLVAFGMLNPNAELMLIFLPIPIKAKYFIPGIIVLDLISATTGVSFFSPSNTAYIAHIGGAVTGFLIMYFWKKNQFNKYRWN